MPTVKEYVTQLRNRETVIARKLGADITRADKDARVLNLAFLTLIAVVVKTLIDKGVITDAELVATLNAARDDAYADQPVEPPEEP